MSATKVILVSILSIAVLAIVLIVLASTAGSLDGGLVSDVKEYSSDPVPVNVLMDLTAIEPSCNGGAMKSFKLTADPNGELRYTTKCIFKPERYSDPAKRYTYWEDYVPTQSIKQLATHNVNCGDKSISSNMLNMQENPDKTRYTYYCVDLGKDPSGCTNHKTPEYPYSGDNGLTSFVNKEIDCGENKVLTRVQMGANADRLWYEYRCCDA